MFLLFIDFGLGRFNFLSFTIKFITFTFKYFFRTTPEDNIRRLRAFLSCMRSDTPLMYNTDYVPQHTLIIACVLRYIMTFTEVPILQKFELDALIITAVAPELSKNENTQELQVSLIVF